VDLLGEGEGEAAAGMVHPNPAVGLCEPVLANWEMLRT
jgi:hypothetical protein